ncbi:uncharacterized protein A1O5_02265 [Cladophialophora psammophila CBS 110553]|uniref:Uncharacterized protein n=1 Tax=Cladophialophora psammophila CBS 110553 TaxID=1182543 RepID=W9XAN7_9EURO|nr:uncharacterized protein A1O5_02265 [Cladophialophora psammophila CBS 110553]EXJ73971.1 hypothetical protein A1O5_02265 [Cladophialophora psammophila CBS 110553]
MQVKMKGWPQATALYFTVILCFLAGLLNAGPLQRTKGHTSVVSHWSHTPTSHRGHHAPTVAASHEVALRPSHDIVPSGSAVKRDTELSHDYALVCVDRTLTGLCQQSVHDYYCDSHGRVNHKKQAEKACDQYCICFSISPKPCYKYVNMLNCAVKDNMVVDTNNGTFLGYLSDARVLEDGSLDFTPTKVVENSSLDLAPTKEIAKRHDYALLCQDREHTAWCGTSYQYYCTSNGALNRKSTGEHWCEENCWCFNTKPRIQCFPNAALLTTCLLKGKQVYLANGTLLGDVNDAHIYPNGTLDFRKLVARDSIAASADPQQMICKSHSREVSPFTGGLLYDKNLTMFCAHHGYSCVSDPARAIFTLTRQPGTKDMKKCDVACGCPSSTWKREGTEHDLIRPSPTPSGVTIQDLVLGCSSNNGITKGTWSFDVSLTDYCKKHGYDCGPGPVWVLQHMEVIQECQAGCVCPATPGKRASALSLPSKTRINLEPRANDITTIPATNNLDLFGMTCWSQGRHNESLTLHCRDGGYSCVPLEHTTLRTLTHNGADIPECTHSCRCSNPLAREAGGRRRSEQGTSIDDSKRSVHKEIAVTGIKIPGSTAVAPPSGVPSQSSRFALNCGNVADGPSFCQQLDLGYFCGYNMTVMRTSTVQNQGVTWCDYYCSCIFRDPIPCVNEWNIPLCREMWDGTVRDASRLQIVLAYVEDVIILPNNSILLDRGQDGGFPFVAAAHGRHGPGSNGTWTDWPTNGTANAW